MENDLNKIDIFLQRQIEAAISVPLIKAYIDEFGRQKAMLVAERVIKELALKGGKTFAKLVGGNTIEHFKGIIPFFEKGGALECEIVETDKNTFGMNVTRCRYAEMYKSQGIEEFGHLLSCGRDFALVEGFNPKIKLTRTKTLMAGKEFCDFRFSMREED